MRTGFFGAYALDWNTVATVAADMGIPRDESFWNLVSDCEPIIIRGMRGK